MPSAASGKTGCFLSGRGIRTVPARRLCGLLEGPARPRHHRDLSICVSLAPFARPSAVGPASLELSGRPGAAAQPPRPLDFCLPGAFWEARRGRLGVSGAFWEARRGRAAIETSRCFVSLAPSGTFGKPGVSGAFWEVRRGRATTETSRFVSPWRALGASARPALRLCGLLEGPARPRRH